MPITDVIYCFVDIVSFGINKTTVFWQKNYRTEKLLFCFSI